MKACYTNIEYTLERVNILKNNELINALYQNADMGITSIKKIYPKIQNRSLKNEVKNQFLNYKQQQNKYVNLMKTDKIAVEKVPLMIKAMTSTGIALNCAKDDSSEHIAEILVQGTNMGIIKINQVLNRTSNSNDRFVDEAKLMLKKEQQYIENLKKYL